MDIPVPVLKTFQPLERKPVTKVVDKPVEPELQTPRRPAVPPPQPPVIKSPVSIHFSFINLTIHFIIPSIGELR